MKSSGKNFSHIFSSCCALLVILLAITFSFKKKKVWQKLHKMNKVIQKSNQSFPLLYLDKKDVILFSSDQ